MKVTYLLFPGTAPLTAVQLLWVNLIMDTLGALALATEPPYDELMMRPPVGRYGSFISNVMWRNIFGQAIYQLAVLSVLQYKGKQILHLEGDGSTELLNTMIFNAFVFCQVFCYNPSHVLYCGGDFLVASFHVQIINGPGGNLWISGI